MLPQAMDNQRDLELILQSRMPIVVIETRDESRMLQLLKDITITRASEQYLPLFRWTITDGMQRLDIDLEPQLHNSDPDDALKHIRAVTKPGVYVLLDFHPYLEDPVNVRLLKDICIRFNEIQRHIVLISHKVKLPHELEPFSAKFELALPTDEERGNIVRRVASEYAADNPGTRVTVDSKAHDLLIRNLAGLTSRDTEQLARNAIYHDGAITSSDIPAVMQAKYELLNRGGMLHFEYDTVRFNEVGGLDNLKLWLSQRKIAFGDSPATSKLDTPKGILLIGVQGCGKSLAAKATAGILGTPILRLDFAALYNKYHGETERNLRESLKTADVMAPCVLWIDEIEKGLAGQGGETGTTQRVLGTFLTWMAEKNRSVFVVATANDITSLPPELVRKGRFDEILFVDLPKGEIRVKILHIHLSSRGQNAANFDLRAIALATRGFSGAEIEQVVVSAMYTSHSESEELGTKHLLLEASKTKPLSVVMAEKVGSLRSWASGRTVPAS
jgi:SpoVK/Ycf46/Vps4 family AAA+-type ATPase